MDDWTLKIRIKAVPEKWKSDKKLINFFSRRVLSKKITNKNNYNFKIGFCHSNQYNFTYHFKNHKQYLFKRHSSHFSDFILLWKFFSSINPSFHFLLELNFNKILQIKKYQYIEYKLNHTFLEIYNFYIYQNTSFIIYLKRNHI